MNEPTTLSSQRTLRPLLAFLYAVFGMGFGLLYVGELRWATLTVVSLFAVVAVAGWSGLMTEYVAGLWAVWIICIGIFVASVIFPVIIAIRNRHRPAKAYNRWWVYLLWLLTLYALVIPVRTDRAELFRYDLFRAPTVAMSPTIQKDDFFTVDSWWYHSHAPARGEIVVFTLGDGSGTHYVKRIVGVAGDHIEIRDSTLIRNGRPVSEPYLHSVDGDHHSGRNFGPVAVGENQVFVLGDFRDNSKDSRHWGVIPVSQVEGRAQFVWLSFSDGHFQGSRIGADLRPAE